MNEILTWFWMLRVEFTAWRLGIKSYHASIKADKPCWRSYKELHAVMVSKGKGVADDPDLE